MRTLLTILIAVSVTLSGSGQITFKKTFGTTGFEDGRSVLQLADSSYIVVGSTGEFGQSGGEVYIMKIDSAGNFLWSNTIGGINVDRANQVILSLDSSLVIVGTTNSFGNGGYDAYLIKADIDGNLIWETSVGGTDWDFGNSVAQLSDSSYVMTGESYSYGSGNAALYLARLNKVGGVLWENAYLWPGDASGQKVIAASNGNIVLAGYNNNGSDNDARVMEITPSGSIVWSSTVGSVGFEDEFYDILELPSNNYAACGSTTNGPFGAEDMLIMGLDQTGDTMWINYQGGPNIDKAYTLSHIPAPDEYYMTGVTYSYGAPDGFSNVQIYHVNNSGWYMQAWGLGLAGDDAMYSIITSSDGGYCTVGSTAQGSGGTDIWVVKYDAINDSLDSGDTSHVDITSIEETSTEKKFIIYPNPANQFITISGQALLESVTILDLNGRVVKQIDQPISEIRIDDIPVGMYLITGTGADGTEMFRQKFIRSY